MLFGTGFIVCIAGAVRIYYFYQLNTTYDKTWLSYPTWICGTLELYLGIVSISLNSFLILLTKQMATTIPAIKPLVARYFPNMLGLNFTRHGQGTDGHIKSLEPYPERTHISPDLESTSEFVRIPSPELDATEKGLVHAKSRPLILSPVVSAFSTYGKEEPTQLATQLKGSTPTEGESSKTSISSFDATWTPK